MKTVTKNRIKISVIIAILFSIILIGLSLNNSLISSFFQGTYGTALHVDAQTHFDPRQFVNGGTIANGMSYSYEGSNTHCGNNFACW